jgi:hypothetical protein
MGEPLMTTRRVTRHARRIRPTRHRPPSPARLPSDAPRTAFGEQPASHLPLSPLYPLRTLDGASPPPLQPRRLELAVSRPQGSEPRSTRQLNVRIAESAPPSRMPGLLKSCPAGTAIFRRSRCGPTLR